MGPNLGWAGGCLWFELVRNASYVVPQVKIIKKDNDDDELLYHLNKTMYKVRKLFKEKKFFFDFK